ncbi:hypothetical protein RB195_006779 [Necator americanus]|uniref:ZP domain-containing protein n=1 Tax=Necator americanus TaxID=51031 RepID=A0ABR1BU67_NECAM
MQYFLGQDANLSSSISKREMIPQLCQTPYPRLEAEDSGLILVHICKISVGNAYDTDSLKSMRRTELPNEQMVDCS